MVEQVTTFADMLALLDMSGYVPLPEPFGDTFDKIRTYRARGEAGDNEFLLAQIAPLGQDRYQELLRVYAAVSLKADQLHDEQLARLKDRLLRDESPSVQIAIVKKLQQVPRGEVAPILMEALVQSHDPQVQAALAYAIREAKAPLDWRAKVAHLLDALAETGLYRENLDMAVLITAVQPTLAEIRVNRFVLTHELIGKAITYTAQRPMLGILAGLIIESAGRNLNRANQVVRAYQDEHHLPAIRFKHLLAEMNNILTSDEWATRLETTFQTPLKETEKQIHAMWQASIRSVLDGMILRRRLSAALFIVSFVTIVVALGLFISADTGLAALLTLLGLVLLITAVFYSGPVRDTKKTLMDIGVANAVYAAYVQRTLEISNGFTRLYLQGELNSKEIEKSNRLIGEAMKEAVNALRSEGSGTLEDLINSLN